MDKIQKICVTGFIYDNEKVLVLKRSGKENFLSGYFEMPGGKIEFGESSEDALVRETKEETGLDIKIIKPYSTFSYTSDDGGRHTIDIQFIAKLIGDKKSLKLDEGHDDFKWIGEKEVDNYLISDLMKKAIKDGFKSL